MITNFEEITYELTDYEKNKLLPIIVSGLKTKIGKENAVTNVQACKKLKELGYKVSGARFRKIVNYIRTNNVINLLVSTSKGYFIATKEEEVINYLESLKQRINSITTVYDAMEHQYIKAKNAN